jgi:hypothetical protein
MRLTSSDCSQLATSVVSLKQGPLEIWEEMKLGYPRLHKLAHTYFIIIIIIIGSTAYYRL